MLMVALPVPPQVVASWVVTLLITGALGEVIVLLMVKAALGQLTEVGFTFTLFTIVPLARFDIRMLPEPSAAKFVRSKLPFPSRSTS